MSTGCLGEVCVNLNVCLVYIGLGTAVDCGFTK